MKKTIKKVIILVMGISILSNFNLNSQPVNPLVRCIESKAVKFVNDMRKLWEDHVTWTRLYIISAAYDNGDTKEVAKRLFKNQDDIGAAIKSFYGEDASSKLVTLLKKHIELAANIVTAAKKDDKAALEENNTKWYENANEIADFLSKANPENWPQDAVRKMMKDHLDLTKQEAVDILGKKYEAGIADYDKIVDEILMMADALSSGIIKQFPHEFKK